LLLRNPSSLRLLLDPPKLTFPGTELGPHQTRIDLVRLAAKDALLFDLLVLEAHGLPSPFMPPLKWEIVPQLLAIIPPGPGKFMEVTGNRFENGDQFALLLRCDEVEPAITANIGIRRWGMGGILKNVRCPHLQGG
jgi:hypothetical protein